MTTTKTQPDIKKLKASTTARLERSARLLGDVKALRTSVAPVLPVTPGAGTEPDAQRLALKVPAESGRTAEQAFVSAQFSPAVGGAMVAIAICQQGPDLDLTQAALYLKDAGAVAAAGDLSKLQEMVAIQARTLDLVFGQFLRTATSQTNFDIKEKYIRLALKAQSQCRASVESLAVMQQGPAIFARQANFAQGPQQVNNAAQLPKHLQQPAPAPCAALSVSPDDGTSPATTPPGPLTRVSKR